jgi:PBSX family phage terminase large subunit
MIPQNLSLKQKESVFESNARINIWEGAVRSGKSFSSLIRWLNYIQECPPGNLIMVGRTATTIKRNIVDEIFRILGSQDAKYYSGKQEMNLWGKKIYLVGAADERSESKIRGATFAGAYIDELTLIPESFWAMLLSRLSLVNSKIFATTNPDSPFHYLKLNYLDRAEQLDLKVFKFQLDDNPSLSKSFKENIKKEYTGLWYKRYINGEWCLAEGTIYDFFDDKYHVIEYPNGLANFHIVGVDYGTTNPTAFTLIGYNPSIYPNMWLEDEYYYDSSKEQRQKTDTEYAEDLKKFIAGKNIEAIFIDPTAVSFKMELRKIGVSNLFDAENDVLDGIRFHSKLLGNGTYKICRKCKNAIHEYQSYRWDPKSKIIGLDKPLKVNDHIMDATRYALYSYFYNKELDGPSMSLHEWRERKRFQEKGKPKTIEEFMKPGW